jgi:FkbM family methyltransferase
MTPKHHSLAEFLNIDSKIDIVDIGANPVDGIPPYKSLLESGLVHVIGFEPNPKALEILNSQKGPNETYLPFVIYDGTDQRLRVCVSSGMVSLLEPNADLLSYFHGFPEWGKVKVRLPVDTKRLDDVDEIDNIDFLKIDIQGGELKVFQNGIERLRNCLVIHTEVNFLPMYEDQPLFSEIELFLREHGFILHRFFPLESRALAPLKVDNDIHKGFGQLFWADAVFIKDFTKFDQLSSLQLKKLGLILHDAYASFDVVLSALSEHDKKSSDKLAEGYKNLNSTSKCNSTCRNIG